MPTARHMCRLRRIRQRVSIRPLEGKRYPCVNTALQKRLVEAMEAMEIIDAHEHLRPEKSRIELPVDVFTLFSHYTHGDLRVAGMPENDYQVLFDREIPLQRRWKLFSPYWREI